MERSGLVIGGCECFSSNSTSRRKTKFLSGVVKRPQKHNKIIASIHNIHSKTNTVLQIPKITFLCLRNFQFQCIQSVPSGQNRQKTAWRSFINSALKIQCHIVKNTLLQNAQNAFSVILPTGLQ